MEETAPYKKSNLTPEDISELIINNPKGWEIVKKGMAQAAAAFVEKDKCFYTLASILEQHANVD